MLEPKSPDALLHQARPWVGSVSGVYLLEVPMKRRRRNALIGYVVGALVVASAVMGVADVLLLLKS
jgi:hypothetical protein